MFEFELTNHKISIVSKVKKNCRILKKYAFDISHSLHKTKLFCDSLKFKI